MSVGQSRRAGQTFDPDEGISVLQPQKSNSEDSDQEERAGQVEKGDNWVNWIM